MDRVFLILERLSASDNIFILAKSLKFMPKTHKNIYQLKSRIIKILTGLWFFKGTYAKNYGEPLKEFEWTKALGCDSDITVLERKIIAKEYPTWIKPLLKLTENNDSILELGSGTGELSAILSIYGRKSNLLDFSENNLEFSRKLFNSLSLNGNFIKHDVLEKFPFSDNSFDWIFSSGLLEHFKDEQIISILKESNRICKKGVISFVPNALSIPYRMGKYNLEKQNKWIYGREDPKISMVNCFNKAGFLMIQEETVDAYHALNFLEGYIKQPFLDFYNSMKIDELDLLKQGYLLVTYATKPK